ncbi:hypothetical protein MIV057L [Invertebrate iridescent virus 3]|uniref:Uncharacterized protein 057L n=1 Tax=Invertebrate iridescent virus 3 TaxID=345201 RepID=057L_IIV3|nr:hypothetical protein MIV057L [Invertebrate iridescent virus 3]Q197A3.1 RecName: Full=Uncharacterized protein 057L [Invertebrate iridescent virus 3]ABF82087.1 hypothetical protein MIV057L [Invertebrate iridescent virus 3]
MFKIYRTSCMGQHQSQFLHSGTVVQTVDGVTTTSFFQPCLVFPFSIEIISISLVSLNTTNETKLIKMSIMENSELVDYNESAYTLAHLPGKQMTYLKYPAPFTIRQHQPFFFVHHGDLGDASLTLEYRIK